jgi:hypothetical protein
MEREGNVLVGFYVSAPLLYAVLVLGNAPVVHTIYAKYVPTQQGCFVRLARL